MSLWGKKISYRYVCRCLIHFSLGQHIFSTRTHRGTSSEMTASWQALQLEASLSFSLLSIPPSSQDSLCYITHFNVQAATFQKSYQSCCGIGPGLRQQKCVSHTGRARCCCGVEVFVSNTAGNATNHPMTS